MLTSAENLLKALCIHYPKISLLSVVLNHFDIRRHVFGVLCVPEFALEGSDLTAHGIIGLCGLIQLSLKLPAGRSDSLGLLLALFQLPLQLFDASVRLIRLWKRNTFQAKRTLRCNTVSYKIISPLTVGMISKFYGKSKGKQLTWSLYCSACFRSSSTWVIKSFSFLSFWRTAFAVFCFSLH